MPRTSVSRSKRQRSRLFGDDWNRRLAEITSSEPEEQTAEKVVRELRKLAKREQYRLPAMNLALQNPSGLEAISERFRPPVVEDGDDSLTKKPTGKRKFKLCVGVGDAAENYLASGVLIAPQVVLTAAHSVAIGLRHWVWVGDEVGAEWGRKYEVHGRKERPPLFHPGYIGPPYYRNDLAVLYLKEPVPDVKPLAIASGPEIDPATWVVPVGYGTMSADNIWGTGTRRFVHVPKLNDEVVTDDKGHPVVYDPQTEFVAGKPLTVKNPKDTCAGDSGGPVYLKTREGKWRLAGITSRNAGRDERSCGSGSIYVRLDVFKDWLGTAVVKAGE